MALYKQTAPPYAFPREANGTVKIRYPANLAIAITGPVTPTATNGNMSIVPYYISEYIPSNVAAVSGTLAGASGGGLVGLYSASTGLKSATLIAQGSYTTTTTPASKTVTLATGGLSVGWYLLCAVNTIGTVTNNGGTWVQNFAILGTDGGSGPIGGYSSGGFSYAFTGITTLPTTFASSTLASITGNQAPYFFLRY
ncbi:MAG: hypothetical protein EBT48_01720 [Verrucomicrobia bacterium]|nr:hypothetical protein [Verrucomicrobiota bacterium]